ncbi:MAG: GSU2403 family nucleotidyltransferase fold protein, partial [Solirubrobacterales bacterium]
MEDLEAFARLVTALQPWLGQLVVVGGWAHRLHRFHRFAKPLDHQPLLTRDTDLAFSPDEELAGDVRTALTEAGFTEELFGDDAPPATHYRLGEDEAGFYAEFLTPLRGSGLKRDGMPDATVSKAGITAQKMRHLELVLGSPWSVRIRPEKGIPIAADVELFVPNATSFIVQKLLIHSDRPPHKKAQDILYIHDSL